MQNLGKVTFLAISVIKIVGKYRQNEQYHLHLDNPLTEPLLARVARHLDLQAYAEFQAVYKQTDFSGVSL